jgi:pyruvate/2-oxoglutarate dehydrogenase complex dihydrolipoamide dehydrogenase (E3) component
VQITLKKEASPEIVEKISPDVVLIAIGSEPAVSSIPGLLNTKYWTADQVLEGASILGKRIVIIGGGSVGCEGAELLSEQGKDVTIIEMLDDIALGMDKINRLPLIMALEDNGVEIMTKTRAESVSDKGVRVDCLGNTEFLEYEELVVAAGREPRKDHLADILKKKVKEVYLIGDRVSPRRILEAIHEGFEVATRL